MRCHIAGLRSQLSVFACEGRTAFAERFDAAGTFSMLQSTKAAYANGHCCRETSAAVMPIWEENTVSPRRRRRSHEYAVTTGMCNGNRETLINLESFQNPQNPQYKQEQSSIRAEETFV